MAKNLVIVESPAKAKTIEKFLGADYKVLSSNGHIRDLKERTFSIDIEHNFEPIYEIPAGKKAVVASLKSEANKANTVWLASDEDREGEAISWHLSEVLNLKNKDTKRIVFHEITKNAILEAIQQPRSINLNLVKAQQARRVLDRIVGFELSPVLWKRIKPALSAGRVQSVTVRLIVEREREVQSFHSTASYRVVAAFAVQDGRKKTELKAELGQRFATEQEARQFLEGCKNASFSVTGLEKHPLKKKPAPPFTTSTLQQEANRKLGLSVSQTMSIAQRLYEDGKITYMRTDSVNLSSLALNTAKKVITETMGAEYAKTRRFTTHQKGAQEAHEAIRPTYMANKTIEGKPMEKKLYDLIWKRTVASQMADAEVEKTTITIGMEGSDRKFVAEGETIVFDGFLKVYRETVEDEDEQNEEARALPTVKVGDALQQKSITATERFTQHPPRYTEAGLVSKLEELGIGRPSTYAPTISTIQKREYVEKVNLPGEERRYKVLTLKDGALSEETKTERYGAEKNKLVPTDVGMVVNDFLMASFPDILDYNFTASVEGQFDEIATGHKEWTQTIADFYRHFHPEVERAEKAKEAHKVGERLLGNDPRSGKPVYVKIGRYGPIAQMGSAEDQEKPRFAQLKKNMSIETVTLDEVLELFKLPRTLGQYEGHEVTVGAGRFGPYVAYNKTYVSIPKTSDPLTLTLEEAVQLIQAKKEADQKKHLKKFDEDPDMEILNGRYGPYIAYKGSNYKIPKGKDPNALTLDECKAIVEQQGSKPATARRRTTRRAR